MYYENLLRHQHQLLYTKEQVSFLTSQKIAGHGDAELYLLKSNLLFLANVAFLSGNQAIAEQFE